VCIMGWNAEAPVKMGSLPFVGWIKDSSGRHKQPVTILLLKENRR
jgi:hypothetical protein